MLTEEEIKRIAAEERYRHQLRKSLDEESKASSAPPPVPPAKVGLGKRAFEFFNSSLGMWLLSSVVLTGGAAMLQQIQHNHELAQQHRQTRLQHRYEIEHRLDTMSFQIKRARTAGEAKAALESIFKSAVPLTPELQNRSLGSLYLALQPLLLEAERHKAKEAMNIVKQLEQAELSLHSSPDDKPLTHEQRQQIGRLVDAVHKLEISHE